MTSVKAVSDAPAAADSDDIFFMTNLSPRMTGLPMAVWVSPRGNARHDVRLKVNTSHGNQMILDHTAVVGVRPAPHIVTGQLSTADQGAVFTWITLNTPAIVAYWEGNIDTAELIQNLKPVPPQP